MDAPAIRKVDRRKQLFEFYTAEATPKVVDVPPLDYLMIDGHGDPETSPDFAVATTRAIRSGKRPSQTTRAILDTDCPGLARPYGDRRRVT
jgi:hypothetical protein